MQDREISDTLGSGVGDFPVLHFYQVFLVSCLFYSYVLLADDHVNNVSYFPFMSIEQVFCVLREGYYVINEADC